MKRVMICCVLLGYGVAWGDGAELNILKAENAALRRQVAALRKEVAALNKRVAAFEAKEAAAALARSPYTYRGRKVSPEWFRQMYDAHQLHIAKVGDKFQNVGTAICATEKVGPTSPTSGTRVRAVVGGVLQVLDKQSVLAGQEYRAPRTFYRGRVTTRSPGQAALTYHVTGIDTENLVDNSRLPVRRLIYVGTYRHGSTTVPSYRPHRAVTPDEFREALEEGVVLYKYDVKTTKPKQVNLTKYLAVMTKAKTTVTATAIP